MKKRSLLALLLAATFAVSVPTTAAASLVTFDLTKDLPYASTIGGNSTLTSDRGTTLILSNFYSTGNLRPDYTFSPYGQGSGNAYLNFQTLFPLGTLGHDFGIHGGWAQRLTASTGFTIFNFQRPVEILSIDFLVLTPGDNNETRANITLDLVNTNTVIYRPNIDGSVTTPKVVPFSFPSGSIANELSIEAGSNSFFSIRSIKVNDPSVAPVPEPSSFAVFCGLGLSVVGITCVRRRKSRA